MEPTVPADAPTRPSAAADPRAPARPGTVAYVMPRFPVVTQTFVVNEILEMRRQGVRVEVHPLLAGRETVVHPAARGLEAEAHRRRILSLETLRGHLHWAVRRPRAYAGVWAGALRGAGRSPARLAQAAAAVGWAAPAARAMSARRVAHVHAHFATHAALAAWAIRRLAGIPYSITAHSHDLTADGWMLDRKFGEARFVAVVAEYYRRWLRPRLTEAAWSRLTVVRCGVDIGRLRPREERPPGDPPVLVCPARLDEMKGHRYLLAALALLRERGAPARLVVAGDGPLRAELEGLTSRHGLDDAVEFTGRVPHETMLGLMAGADVVVLPSATTEDGRREGVPVALMEAMALAVPVVATEMSGVPELVEHGRSGLLVPERDPSALAAAVEEVLADPGRARGMALAGSAAVREGFSLEASCARLRGLLDGAAGPGAGAPPA